MPSRAVSAMKPPPLFLLAPQTAASAGWVATAGFGVKAPVVLSVVPQADDGIENRPFGNVLELPVPDCALGTQTSVFGSAKQPLPVSMSGLDGSVTPGLPAKSQL